MMKKKEITSLEGETLKYDYLFLTPPHKPAGFLKGSDMADEDGWVKVGKEKRNSGKNPVSVSRKQ